MKQITMVDFRRDSEKVLARVKKGERLILTHRGKPMARLEPIIDNVPNPDDPFYSLTDLAVPGKSLSNDQIDEIVYGK